MLIGSYDEAIIAFNEQGLIPAEKRHDTSGRVEAIGPAVISLETFKRLFLFNEHRTALFQDFTNWYRTLSPAHIQPMMIWFGGSFVEATEAPSDIDLLLFFKSAAPAESNPKCLSHDAVKDRFCLDLNLINMNGHPADIIHNAARYVLYYSIPNAGKLDTKDPACRRAVISVVGSELSKL